MGFDLLPHNQKAYDNVKTIFRTKNRAAVIHPTGTGKGRIARKLIEDNQDKKIIYLSPSLAINNSLEKSLKKHGINTENLEILTYQRLIKMTKEEIEELNADYIVLDEFHHCGAKEWGSVVNSLLASNEEAKVLGLSATPLRYTKAGVRDMAEEIFGNVIASEMSLESAIAEGILNEPTYVTSFYAYDGIVDELEKKVEEYEKTGSEKKAERKKIARNELVQLKKVVHEAKTTLPDVLKQSMPNKNGKYIVFCSSIEDMKAKIEAAPELFQKVNPNIEIRQVSSDENDVAKNEATLQSFEDDNNPDTLKLLFCVNMLNEGYHLKDLDGGIMMRSTSSPTLYTQQFGRIISAGKKGETVLIDLVNNIDAIENIVRFYENLSKARKSKTTKNKAKKFTITKELRNINEVVRKIEGLISRRANVIETNFLKCLGISFDDAKSIIQNSSEILTKGRNNNYDGEYVADEKESLDLFYEMRKMKLKLSSEIEIGTESYNKKLKAYNRAKDEVIIKNMGLARWMIRNIPELKVLEYTTEEDKEQTAMRYLVEAANTYNPKLKTRENKSVRFDEYLLVFLQSGMTQEKRNLEYEKYTAEIFEVKARLENMSGVGEVTDKKIAEIMLTETVEAIDRKDKEFFKNRPFCTVLRDKVTSYRESIAKQRIENEKMYGKIYKAEIDLIRRNTYLEINENDEYLLKFTEFQIRRACRPMQEMESYEAVTDFDIQDYYFNDSEVIQSVGDSYISDGVYIEKQEPFPKEEQAEEEFFRDLERTENNFLKVDLEKLIKMLTEKNQISLRLSYGLGIKKDDVEDGEKLARRYLAIRKAVRLLRHPTRSKYIRAYTEPERTLIFRRGPKREKETALNYEDTNSFSIASGDYESVKLSEIIQSEEVFNHLNESGLWSLKDLLSMTEEQLRTELECTDDMVEDIKEVLEAYGVELSAEEQEDVIAADFAGRTQEQKVKTLKGLMAKKKAQEEELESLEETAHKKQESGERGDL